MSGTRAPRMSPQDRFEQLLPVAEQLFLEHGYAAVTMEDIARAAGVTRPVVYDHFGSKEGAYLACVRRARTSWEGEMRGAIDPSLPADQQLRAGGEAFFSMLERNPARWRLLFGTNGVIGGEKGQELAELRFATIEQVRRVLAHMAPEAPAERLTALAHVVSGAGERLGHWWLTRPDLRREEILDHYVTILMDGLRPYMSRAD